MVSLFLQCAVSISSNSLQVSVQGKFPKMSDCPFNSTFQKLDKTNISFSVGYKSSYSGQQTPTSWSSAVMLLAGHRDETGTNPLLAGSKAY